MDPCRTGPPSKSTLCSWFLTAAFSPGTSWRCPLRDPRDIGHHSRGVAGIHSADSQDRRANEGDEISTSDLRPGCIIAEVDEHRAEFVRSVNHKIMRTVDGSCAPRGVGGCIGETGLEVVH